MSLFSNSLRPYHAGPRTGIHDRFHFHDDKIIINKLIQLLNKRHHPGIQEVQVRKRLTHFLNFSKHNEHLIPMEKERRKAFLRYLVSDDFIQNEKYDYSLDNLYEHVLEEYNAYLAYEKHGNISEKEFTHRLFHLAISSPEAKKKKPVNSFRTREAILIKIQPGAGVQMSTDLLHFFEKKTSGTFSLFQHFISGDDTNLQGFGFELRLGGMLENAGYDGVVFSHYYKGGEIDVIAMKNGQKYFFEAKSSEDKLTKIQIGNLISYAKESDAIPVIVINKEPKSISAEKIKQKLGDLIESSPLKIWDKHLVEVRV